MDKYMIVKKDSKLYRDCMEYKADAKKVNEAFGKVADEFGIEAKEYCPDKNYLVIIPTVADREKFSTMLMKSREGSFKKNSAPGRMWSFLVKDIKWMHRPHLFLYFDIHGRWNERLFDIDGTLYCSISSTYDFETPDFVEEIKASEFHRVIEEAEERNAKANS